MKPRAELAPKRRSPGRLVLVLASLVAALLGLVPAALPLTARSSEGPAFAEYAVAADHPEASAAGAQLLAAGGSAADAAAATMLALGVASPSSSGLGGGGFALYYRASDKSLTFLDFRERAPQAATPDMFAQKPGEAGDKERSRVGGLSIAVPGEPAGIAELVARFGKFPLARAIEPARRLAEQGYTLSAHTARIFGFLGAAFMSEPAVRRLFGAAPPQAGSRVQNPALARSLAIYAKQGPAAFYRGAIGQAMVRAARAAGGLLSARDLADYRVIERPPLSGRRFGYEWFTAPPPSAGGYIMLASLGLLERWLPTPAHWQSTERYHALIESWKGTYLDRQRYFGDPDSVKVPLDALIAPARIERRAALYHPVLALPPETYALPLEVSPPAAHQPDNRGTSHLCVVDAEGNIAAVTTTINLAFGSRVPVEGLWLNDEMDDFASQVGEQNAFGLGGGAPNLPGPGKRPVSSMTPTIVFKDGSPVLCVGGSGGSRIITAVEQVALWVLVDGLSPSRALAAPRLHHQALPREVDARDLPAESFAELERRGHRMRTMGFGADVQAIAIGAPGPERLQAGCEPRKGGEPRGQ